jgi:hypothetical protein
MKLLQALIGTGVYFYAAPILFQYGYNSYFGIPGSFIEPSIRDNIIFFFDLTRVMSQVARNLSFWIWIVFIVTALIIWFLISFKVIRGKILTGILIVLTGLSLLGFFNFGNKLAETVTEFRVLSEGCLPKEENITYIIPSFYKSTALIVSIYTDTKKLTGKFFPRETTVLNCDIQMDTVIGPISQ